MANLAEIRAPLAYLIVGVLAGFILGRYTPSTSPSQAQDARTTAGANRTTKGIVDLRDELDTEDEEDDEERGELSSFASHYEECKLVLVVRTDLGMTKGKIAAQCSHATLACYKSLKAINSPVLARWERLGQAKVSVQVKSEDELMVLQAQAISLGLCAKVIHDAGRTQIASGSATVLGVGPGPKSVVDQVTGGLKLL